MSNPQPLNRETAQAAGPAPVRLIHLGLGAFHRAHQVYYTQQAEVDPQQPAWGYASFTGRSPKMADLLTAQDGLFTLVTRSGEGDSPELMSSLVQAHPATDVTTLRALMARPEVAVVTLTITEAGYHLAADGSLDTTDTEVSADIAELKENLSPESLATAAGRLVSGLAARRAAHAGGMAIMSCDNIAANGPLTQASIVELAREVDAELATWIEAEVTFPSTSIDRITPKTEPELLAEVAAETGFTDASPVVTEPFASWVIEGEFPAGRPDWERAGVEFVTDIDAFESRKLWLLNGSHSLMAYYGQLRGHRTVAEAIADPAVRARVEQLWDEAAAHLSSEELQVPAYRDSLIERFTNPRIAHFLAQIGIDGGTKQRMRAVPILKAELAQQRAGEGALFSIAAWIAFLLQTAEIQDSRAAELEVAKKNADPVKALLAALDEDLAAEDEVLGQIRGLVAELQKA
ncbi:mannitol dehydrogenase family protein [Corynebacterium sp. A21]|uniref:mannitol dehydrogenase family protein n=1 Tax=Corynebacterium sp. A21 TaxID=3457318 RepID=UPI003FD18AB5